MAPQNETPARLLSRRTDEGNSSDSEDLDPLVYGEGQRYAGRVIVGSAREHKLQATGLVHEANPKPTAGDRKEWDGRRRFFSVAATPMRRILPDFTRNPTQRNRRAGTVRMAMRAVSFEDEDSLEARLHPIQLDEALEESGAVNPRIHRVVELRFLAGITVEEVAMGLGAHERSPFKGWPTGSAILSRRVPDDENGVDR